MTAPVQAEGGHVSGPNAADRGIPPLEVKGVTVRFGALAALSEVSFTVAPGHVHAIIGPNGAGKSTMFNVLSGVYRASEGEVRFGDRVLTDMRPHQIAKLKVARAFQNIALSGGQTVAENLMLGRHHLTKAGFLSAGLRLPKATREAELHGRRVREIADFMELGDKFDIPVGVLSYGDQKRVEVARALCTEPDLLLLDEPVAGMNSEETRRMAEAVLEIRDALGITIILVEHDMGMVMGIADRVTVLDFGRLIADGTPAEVQADPEVIRAYLGSGDEDDDAQAAAPHTAAPDTAAHDTAATDAAAPGTAAHDTAAHDAGSHDTAAHDTAPRDTGPHDTAPRDPAATDGAATDAPQTDTAATDPLPAQPAAPTDASSRPSSTRRTDPGSTAPHSEDPA